MLKITIAVLVLAVCLAAAATLGAGEKSGSFSPYVDSKGNITLPADFRSTWVHLGTWVVTSQIAAGTELGQTAPATGLHDVYTQPDSLKAYRKDGKWPDGTVLVKEIRTVQWDDMPTGHVIYAGDVSRWFVMMKDTKGRFPGNSNWGEGWGWALFKANDPKKNLSSDYKNDCIGCHELAKTTDWVFIHGYPALR